MTARDPRDHAAELLRHRARAADPVDVLHDTAEQFGEEIPFSEAVRVAEALHTATVTVSWPDQTGPPATLGRPAGPRGDE